MTNRRTIARVAVLAAVLAAPAAGPATAGEVAPAEGTTAATPTTSTTDAAAGTTTTTPPPALALVRQSPWVALGGELALRLRFTGAAGSRQLSFVVHEPLLSRSAFEQTVRGESLGGVQTRVTLPLSELEGVDDGEVVVRFSLAAEEGRVPLRLRRTGVYPLEVSLAELDATAPSGSFVTWIVVTPEERIDTPLSVSWIWTAVADPLATVDGAREPEVVAELRDGGRLARLAGLLAEADGVPLTIQVNPETLEAWKQVAADDPAAATGLDAALTAITDPDNQLLPMPYVPLRLPDLEASGLGALLQPQLLTGSDVLRQQAGARVDPRTFYVDPVDAATLDRLRALFVDRVVVRDTALVPLERHLTPARPFILATDSLQMRAAATNEALAALLEPSAAAEPAGLRAQRFIAGLSIVALEAPALPRGLLFAAPDRWEPDTALVRLVLDGLREHPLLQTVTLDTYFATVPDDTVDDGDGPVVRTLAPASPGEFPLSADEYRGARESLASFRSVVGADDPRIARGQRALLLAVNSVWTRARARAEIAVIDDAAAAFLSAISTTEKDVTLTARRARIPLSFRNDTGQPVRVRVRLDSTKLLFPDGAETVVDLPEGNTTERFAVEARASGTFTMTVTLTSEDGHLPIGAPTRVTVRSTVFGGVGAALTLGALLFLAGWWGNHVWRQRRRRREQAA